MDVQRARTSSPPRPHLGSDDGLRLRAHSRDDAADVFAQGNDPAMQRWTSVPVPYEMEHALAFLDGLGEAWDAGRSYAFAIEHGGRYAGSIDLRPDGAGAAEVGFGLASWARGQKVMSRSLRLVVPWGFQALDLDVVHWRAEVGNWPSRRVAWSVGFRYDGQVRAMLPAARPHPASRRRDAWVASLLRGEPMEPATRWLSPPLLVTANAVLRAYRAEDADRVVEACADPASQRWLPMLPSPYTLQDAHAHLADIAEAHASGRRITWAVCDAGSAALMGEVSLFRLEERSGRCEIGYWAHPQARRRRITTNAVRAVVDHALTATRNGGLGLRGVVLRAADGNEASIGVAKAAGFRAAGRDSRAENLRNGAVVDLLRFEAVA